MAVSIIDSPVDPVNSEVSPDQLAWNNDSPDNDPSDGYPGEGWDTDRYEPTPHAAAQDAGYARGYALDWAAQPDADLDSLTRLCWNLGKLDGIDQRKREDADRAAFENDLAESALAAMDRHPSEVVRAIGVLAARREGGSR